MLAEACFSIKPIVALAVLPLVPH